MTWHNAETFDENYRRWRAALDEAAGSGAGVKLIQFRSHARDLYADIGQCDCKRWPDSVTLGHICKTITLSGYADDNFFDNVNATPRTHSCRQCGAEFLVQWRRDGVLCERLAKAGAS